jgi:hypothetical protein
VIYSAPIVPIDLTRLSEDELVDLNRRIVERLQLIRSAKQLTQLARSRCTVAQARLKPCPTARPQPS